MLFSSLPRATAEGFTNHEYVKTSPDGSYYVKSVPDHSEGSRGKTFLYKANKDEVICQLDWFANGELFVSDNGFVVRVGSWGKDAPQEDDPYLAIAFYKQCQKLKSYSIDEIIPTPKDEKSLENGQPVTTVHFQPIGLPPFQKISGFRSVTGNGVAFDAELQGGEKISFNGLTGEKF